MVGKGKMVTARLDRWDRDLLEQLATVCQCSEVEMVRRAIRFYAASGPFPDADKARVLRRHKKRLLQIGSLIAEV